MQVRGRWKRGSVATGGLMACGLRKSVKCGARHRGNAENALNDHEQVCCADRHSSSMYEVDGAEMDPQYILQCLNDRE